MGRPVQAVREARPAGRGDSLVSHTSTSTKRGDVYSRITAEIVATIERGAGEWRAPWFHNGAECRPPDQCRIRQTLSRHQHAGALDGWARR